MHKLPHSPHKRQYVKQKVVQVLSGKHVKRYSSRGPPKISPTVITAVQNFYNDDAISRQAPGMREFVPLFKGDKMGIQKVSTIYQHVTHNFLSNLILNL
jgi:hypothetical protein